MMIVKWKAHSTEYPCLGHWSIFIDGVDHSDCIPVEKRTEPMMTRINECGYRSGHYFHEVLGYDFAEWVKYNDWIHKIPVAADELYNAIREYDWRCLGGCAVCRKKEKA